jgi:hypothetical protein
MDSRIRRMQGLSGFVIRDWRLAIRDWRLAISDWRLAISDWRLAISDWRFVRLAPLLAAGALLVSAAALRLDAHERITTNITWDVEISRIFQARCVSCHTDGGAAPMPLETYEQARPWARAIRDEVLARRMPKWHAARGYGDFTNDPSLSPFEVGLIASWAGGGAPKRLPRASIPEADPPAPATPPTAADDQPTLRVGCGEAPLVGRLLGVRPTLDAGASAAISARLPDGRQEIVAWIRGYDPRFPTTYWLRRPLDLPHGSVLTTRAEGSCGVTLVTERDLLSYSRLTSIARLPPPRRGR